MRHHRKRDPGIPAYPMPVCAVEDDISRAKEAQQASHRRFMEAATQGPEIRRVSSEMRALRERNGFGKMIKGSMGLR